MVLPGRPSLRKVLQVMVRRIALFVEDVVCWIVSGICVIILLSVVLWMRTVERVIEGRNHE